MSLVAAAMMGVGLGIRHAFEADHIAAVCAMVSRDQGGPQRALQRATRWSMPESVASAARVGALWGLGHGAVIIFAGGGLVALGASVPTPIAAALDAAVAVMLVVLGVRAILGARRSGEPRDVLHHGHQHLAKPANPCRAVLIGLLHGASGTAALTLLVAAQIQARFEAITFIVLFGVASVLGMTGAAAFLAWPLHKAVRDAPTFARRLRGASGLASIAAGIAVAWTVIGPSALS
jgi:nickel/cobalt transporter (NicO) family protein